MPQMKFAIQFRSPLLMSVLFARSCRFARRQITGNVLALPRHSHGIARILAAPYPALQGALLRALLIQAKRLHASRTAAEHR